MVVDRDDVGDDVGVPVGEVVTEGDGVPVLVVVELGVDDTVDLAEIVLVGV